MQHAAVGAEQELARLNDVALGVVEGADAVGVLGDAEAPGDREAEAVLLDRLARLLERIGREREHGGRRPRA